MSIASFFRMVAGRTLKRDKKWESRLDVENRFNQVPSDKRDTIHSYASQMADKVFWIDDRADRLAFIEKEFYTESYIPGIIPNEICDYLDNNLMDLLPQNIRENFEDEKKKVLMRNLEDKERNSENIIKFADEYLIRIESKYSSVFIKDDLSCN